MTKEVDLGRLSKAVQHARKALQYYRETRRQAVRQYVGKHWAEEGADQKVPVNLLALYVNVVGRSLIANDPRMMLSTFERQHKPAVNAMQSWVNDELVQQKIADTLRRVVIDGLFSLGIAKVALTTPADAAVTAYGQQAGEPYCCRVDLDDFVFDVHARDFCEVSFIGHRFRVPLSAVKDSTLYSKKRKELTPTEDRHYNEDGDERIAVLGRGYQSGDYEEFEDMVDLWEIYLPRRRLILTLASDDGGLPQDDEVLLEQEWIGPDSGPYHILGYGVVPGNAMPKAPIQDLIDLHELVNNLYRKLMRQAERQKELLLVRGAADADGRRIIDASDGDAVKTDDPQAAKVATYGGPNQANFLFAQQAKEWFTYLAGNLDLIGGLSPQSKTATQDKMLNENASRAVAGMQDQTVTFTADVGKSLGWYWWNHPTKVMETEYVQPGLPELRLTRQVYPYGAQKPNGEPQMLRRQAPFQDLKLKVDPYSLQHSTPQSRAQALTQVVMQVIAPMMGLLQQQGVQFDVGAFLSKIAQYTDMPDLPEIMTIGEPPAPEGESTENPGMPAQTSREYVRRSLGQDSAQAKDADLMAELMKGSGQNNGTVE